VGHGAEAAIGRIGRVADTQSFRGVVRRRSGGVQARQRDIVAVEKRAIAAKALLAEEEIAYSVRDRRLAIGDVQKRAIEHNAVAGVVVDFANHTLITWVHGHYCPWGRPRPGCWWLRRCFSQFGSNLGGGWGVHGQRLGWSAGVLLG